MSEPVARPPVTVVMPAYNAERYIGEALQSICDQQLPGVEVIVVDDGSSDGTIREAERYAGRLDLTLLRQRNGGPSAARNAGIRRGRGRYCAFLDADDIMLPGLLATQCAMMDADPSVGMVISEVATFNESGIINPARWNLAATPADRILERLVLENFVTTSAVMARPAAVAAAGFFPEHRTVAEDYELWLRIAARWKIALVPDALVHYRYTSGSLSADKVYSTRCALDVIETFWREHDDLTGVHPGLDRRSRAVHTANVGAAASAAGDRLTALKYLLRSLNGAPARSRTWKELVKLLLPRRHPRPGQPLLAAQSNGSYLGGTPQ